VEKTDQRNEFFEELKHIRESKGLQLEDVAHRYRIRLSFLESIEGGGFENLPEPVYTKTFIKTYAGILGIDAGPIVARYEKYIEKTQPPPPPEAPKEQLREARSENAVFDRLKGMGSRRGWAVLAVVFIVVLGIYVSRDGGQNPAQVKTTAREAVKPPEKLPEPQPVDAQQAPTVQQPEAAPQQGTAAQAPAPELKKQEAPPAAEKKEPPAPAPSVAGPLSLTIEATEAAWVQVKADKTPAVQKLMQAGEKLTTEAKERITIDLGNAGGVQITFQGQSLGSPGKRGEVVHLVYPEGKRIEKKKTEEPKPAAEPVTKPAAQ